MLNIALLLAAISAVGSGDNDHLIGKRGEISRYQILPAIWVEHSRFIPLKVRGRYWNNDISAQVAERVIWRIQNNLPAKLKDDPGILILCWKKGPTGAKRLSYHTQLAKPKTQDYCERVWNTYQEKIKACQVNLPAFK